MALKLDLCGIQLEFAINNYKPSTEHDRFATWCDVEFCISSADWLNYRIEGELLMNDEVLEILSRIDDILNCDVGDPNVWECMEPDFKFTFYPKNDRTKDPKYLYVRPGCEIEDIRLEWSVYFWDGRLSGNRITLVLSRENIVELRQYLASVVF